MKKRYVWLFVSAALVLTVAVGATLALLVTSSNTVQNTFTIGKVELELTETTGTEYKMAPGVTIVKNPTVTLKANSEDCWVFVKIQKSADFDSFCSYSVADGWTALTGYDGVYYQKCEKAAADRSFKVLKNDRVTVKSTLTEEQLNAITVGPTLKFTAYAIQSDGFNTAANAWNALNQ